MGINIPYIVQNRTRSFDFSPSSGLYFPKRRSMLSFMIFYVACAEYTRSQISMHSSITNRSMFRGHEGLSLGPEFFGHHITQVF